MRPITGTPVLDIDRLTLAAPTLPAAAYRQAASCSAVQSDATCSNEGLPHRAVIVAAVALRELAQPGDAFLIGRVGRELRKGRGDSAAVRHVEGVLFQGAAGPR